MNRDKDNNNQVQNQEVEEQEKDLISFEDVSAAISGDETAITEQLERAKQVAVEQSQIKEQEIIEQQEKIKKEAEEKKTKEKEAKEQAKIKIASTKYKKVEEKPKQVEKTEEESTPQSVEVTEELESNEPSEPKKEEQPKVEEQQVPQKPIKKVMVKKKKKKEGNAKYYLLIIFFIVLFGFVYFLPEISKYMAEREMLKNANSDTITTGNLECKKSDSDDNLDYDYNYTFAFRDNKLLRLSIKTTTSGSLKEDEETLDKINEKCETLKDQTNKLKGINIRCILDNYSTTVVQELRYGELQEKKVTNSYIEAGGTYPNYDYKQDINKIEREMKAAGYKCERTK